MNQWPPLDLLPLFPDRFLRACFPFLLLDSPAPGNLRGNHQIDTWAKVCLTFNGLGLAMDPDCQSLPGVNRLELVNHQGDFLIACHHIFVLARGGDVVTANVEVRPIKGEADSISCGLSIRGDGGDPGNALRLKECQLLFGKHRVPLSFCVMWWYAPQLPNLPQVWQASAARFTGEHPFHFVKQFASLSTTPALRDQGGDDGFSVGTDPFALVATDVVDVDLVEAQVEETLDVSAVLIQVGRDKDAAVEMVWTHQFCEFGEIFR